ncbi:MAG: hypothetical protein JWM78_1872 [Verrucomicrobiaceae bacterium]|nr:hypothetical protein [Verrucomicrobiaceae bacterium]
MRHAACLIVVAVSLISGCATKKLDEPESFSDIANGRSSHPYNLFTPAQARSLDVYPQIAAAANKVAVALPNSDHGSVQNKLAVADLVRAAIVLNPLFIFGKSPLECNYCARLNGLSALAKSALVYPGVGYTKTWEAQKTLGQVVDDVFAELQAQMVADGCTKDVDNRSINAVDPLSDANNYFIAAVKCAEPTSISKNPRFINTWYTTTVGKQFMDWDYKSLVVTRDADRPNVFHASLTSNCFSFLYNMESYDQKYSEHSWYKKRFGLPPTVTIEDYDACRVGTADASKLEGWSRIETYIQFAPTMKSMLRVTRGDSSTDIPSPIQSLPELNHIAHNTALSDVDP